MSCCPEKAWGELTNDNYVAKGVVEKVDDLEMYVVGKGPRTIIWNYDIFGFDSGRTRQTADLFAERGYLVIIPDWYRGTWCDPSSPGVAQFLTNQSDWTKLDRDWQDKVIPFAKKKGATSLGCLGTCWGSYCVIRQSSHPLVKAGVSWHPSHSFIASLMKEDEKELLENIKCDQYFMPAGEDDPATKNGGLGEKILASRLQILEFPTMRHGWTVRGDLSDENVEKDVKKAIEEALSFFNKNL